MFNMKDTGDVFVSFLALHLEHVCGVCSDWLLSRRHCSQNWSEMIVSVREKINSAIQDMPAVDDVANLLRGTCLY